ncbi:hypothetical protein DFH29DRAFT_1073878 [Suillus ampliporus]|nr:hypothetical protein DFH29DRAFT_1073878 [Suillus ampliporus]
MRGWLPTLAAHLFLLGRSSIGAGKRCAHSPTHFSPESNILISQYFSPYLARQSANPKICASLTLRAGFKTIFTSPSSTKADGNGDGADVIENQRHAHRQFDPPKVKTCVASIIGMRKVTPHAITYTACQIRFALSSITLWCTVDGDFYYEIFWNNITRTSGRVGTAMIKTLAIGLVGLFIFIKKVVGAVESLDRCPDPGVSWEFTWLPTRRPQACQQVRGSQGQ